MPKRWRRSAHNESTVASHGFYFYTDQARYTLLDEGIKPHFRYSNQCLQAPRRATLFSFAPLKLSTTPKAAVWESLL
ncbi:putative genetic interactor of prohibitin 3 [Trichinella pseudospiralis]